ncbi:ROK family transcriptional regulator [Caloramator proteoclasticus]|uniref:Sugar kinase of the NBD/HSP70 family, may contain an N-terminal HTH domain n=1 Tax=Caloramator proteoclasticus DSM 10124 TaxID=1121262 RepID=A0A1M4XJG2_9CLOT|nr:ROK family transcriptional regulator [Caloramator proteoclasticus]SHE93526.1 Sugar kinase of the NBD/HSP70 family, may contain an N-terminal HTH domain [Caloramator proteoclasticus DSM 10124]
MDIKGRNMESIKIINRGEILKILYNNGQMSRKKIAELIGLTSAAITVNVKEMIEEGLIVETGEVEDTKRAGRKEINIDINYKYKYVIGVCIEQPDIIITLGRLNLDIVDVYRVPVQKGVGYRKVIEIIKDGISIILNRNSIERKDILGVGVGVIGEVDSTLGVSKNSFGIIEKNVPIKEELEKRLNMKVYIDNNVRTLALGEILSSKDNSNNESLLFIKYGFGVGSAIIIDNKIYSGNNNKAGEIGHTIVYPDGLECRCGKQGCLETIASMWAVGDRLQKIYSKDNTPILYEITSGNINDINKDTVLMAYELKDDLVVEIVDEALYYFCLSLENYISLLDPSRIILYGSMFEKDIIIEKIKNIFVEKIKDDAVIEKLQRSQNNGQLEKIGPISIVVDRFISNGGYL